MKRFTSVVLALSLMLTMLVLATTVTGAVSNNVPTAISVDSTQFVISEFDRNSQGEIKGDIHGYMGDADGDDDVSVMDATEIQLYVARLKTLDDIHVLLSDVDRDGDASVIDATEIQLFIARVINSDVINHALYTPIVETEPPTEPPTEGLKPENGARLTVWAPYGAVDTFTQQCEDFVDKYSEYNLRIRVVEMGEGDATASILNDPYYAADVFGFVCDQLDRLDNADVILPVDKKLVADVTNRNVASSVSAATINNKLLAYPETADNGYFLYYDKRYVSDNDAKTLEGILAACRRANKDFIMDAGNGYYACMFPFTGGLRIEGFEGYYNDIQKFNNYDEDEVVATMRAFALLFHEYDDVFVSTSVSRIPAGFASSPSTVAAGIDGSWDAKTIKNILGKNFGVVKLPTINVNGENKQLISMHGFKLIGVNAVTMYPDAAQLLADYLSGEKCQLERAKSLAWGPSNTNAANSDLVQSDPAMKAALEQSLYSVPQVNIAYTFWDPMGNLGTNLCDPYARYDTYTLTNLLNRTIANIRDE